MTSGVGELGLRFVESCARHESAPALVDGAGELSYGKLADEVARVVAALALTDTRGTVGVHLPRGRSAVVSVLAVAGAGRTYTPLPPDCPDLRLRHFMAAAGVEVVLTDRLGVARAKEVFRPASVIDLDDLPPGCRDGSALAAPDATSGTAYIMFTSGSTGTPKGVAVPPAALLNLVEAGRAFATLDQQPVCSHVANPAFDVTMFEIWAPLLTGGTIAILENPNPLSWGPQLVRAAGRRPTVLTLTTSIFHQIARRAPSALHGVGTILFGGEMAAGDILRSLVSSGFTGRLQNVYGPTEATTATAWEVTGEWLDRGLAAVPVGPPVHGVTAGLRDEHSGSVVGNGVGQLVIGGAGLARGYVGDDALTAQRFTSDPAGRIDGTIYWTGDLARWCEDGVSLLIVGRADRQLKVRGFRIEPGEVEAALRSLPWVLEAAVVAVGEHAHRALAALVVLRGGVETTADELADAMRRRLPSHMVPKRITSVAELPRTNNGKVNLAEVRRILELPLSAHEAEVPEP